MLRWFIAGLAITAHLSLPLACAKTPDATDGGLAKASPECEAPYIRGEFTFFEYDDAPAAVNGLMFVDAFLADGRPAVIRDKKTGATSPLHMAVPFAGKSVWGVCVELGTAPGVVALTFQVRVAEGIEDVAYIISECENHRGQQMAADLNYWNEVEALREITMRCSATMTMREGAGLET
jgi:hypothetical protein